MKKIVSIIIPFIILFQINASALTYSEWKKTSLTHTANYYDRIPIPAPYSVDTSLFATNVYEIKSMIEFERMFEEMLKYKILNMRLYIKDNAELEASIKKYVEDYSITHKYKRDANDVKFLAATFMAENFVFAYKNDRWAHPSYEQGGRSIRIQCDFSDGHGDNIMPIDYLPRVMGLEELSQLYSKTIGQGIDKTPVVALCTDGFLETTEILDYLNNKCNASLTPENIYLGMSSSGSDGVRQVIRISIVKCGEYSEPAFILLDYSKLPKLYERYLLKKIRPDMDDYTKVKIIAYTVGEICRAYKVTDVLPRDLAIADETGQCMHFAHVFKALCDICGVENKLVGGQLRGVSHAWNMVNIDGEWYQYEPQTYRMRYRIPYLDVEKMGFELTTDEMMRSRGYTWYGYPACTSEKYYGSEYSGDNFDTKVKRFQNTKYINIPLEKEYTKDEYHVICDEWIDAMITMANRYIAFAIDAETGTIKDVVCNLAGESKLEIPSVIDGITIKAIGSFAFQNQDAATLVLPETLEKIESYACSYRTHFDKVIFKGHTKIEYDGITAYEIEAEKGIEMEGFTQPIANIWALDEDTFCNITPDITVIRNNSHDFDAVVPADKKQVLYNAGQGFYYDGPRNTLTVHKDVSYIDPQVGYLNRYYIVDENNPYYSSVDGVLYNKDKTKLISVPVGTKSIKIPETVKEIGRFAFSYIYNLKELEIPASVSKVDSEAFLKVVELRDIILDGEIPQGLTINSPDIVKVHSMYPGVVEGAQVTDKFYADITRDNDRLVIRTRDNSSVCTAVYDEQNNLIDVIYGEDGYSSYTIDKAAYKIKTMCIGKHMQPCGEVRKMRLG